MRLHRCLLTHSRCYIARDTKGNFPNGKKMSVCTGIVVHDTGAGNPKVSRYVQPHESDYDYDEQIEFLGKNPNGNDWNHSGRLAGVHAFIGKVADGNLATVETLPYSQCCWGVDSGILGSYNYNPTARIQFEICDDGYKSEEYFYSAMREAQEYCAYLCKMFGLDPKTQICSHYQAHLEGYGGNHGDIDIWLSIFGKNMDWFTSEVAEIMNNDKRYKTIEEVPEALRAETQELIDSGALKGRGDELGLDLTDDMLRSIIISKRYTDSKSEVQK